MSREWKVLPLGGWALMDEAGEAVDTLHHDRESGQYRDARGVLVGREWGAARESCESRAGKDRKVGKRR